MEWMCLRCRNFNRTLAFTHYEHCGISFCYANRMHKTVFVHRIKCVNEKIIEMLVLWALCCFAPNPFSFPPSHAMFLFSSFSSFQLQSSRFYFKLFAVQQQYLSVCDCLRVWVNVYMLFLVRNTVGLCTTIFYGCHKKLATFTVLRYRFGSRITCSQEFAIKLVFDCNFQLYNSWIAIFFNSFAV